MEQISLDDMREETKIDGQSIQRIKAPRRYYWVTMTVVILGLLSILLFAGISRLDERQHMNLGLANTLLDIRAKLGLFHLWLEQAIAGDTNVDIEGAWVEFEEAFALVEKIIGGGVVLEPGFILTPIKDPEQQKEAEEIRRLLSEFKTIAIQRQQAPKTSGIGSAVDQQFDDIFLKLQHRMIALGAAIKDRAMSERTRSRRLFRWILMTWTSIIVISAIGLWTLERRRLEAEKALQMSHRELQAKTEDLEKHREHLAAAVEERTAELTSVNQQLQQEITECEQTYKALHEKERQLRHLSSELLTAQEAERKRISGELHDELGGELAALKMGIGYVDRRLREDQIDLRERNCRNFEIVDQIIDNVHRISRNLTPYLLEDLGLSTSLRSLIDGFRKDFSHINTSIDIPDIDPLFSQIAQIILYRILQESLTNIGKHSGAKNVSVVIERQQDAIDLIVEDDGKGFDVEEVSRRNPMKMGLGLTTMRERVRMLGGVFCPWSQEGNGTRLTFTIPVKKEAS